MKLIIGIIFGSLLMVGIAIWALIKEFKRQINNN